MSEPVNVACPCEGTPHPDGDTVVLRSKLGLQAGIAVQSLLIEQLRTRENRLDSAEVSGILAEAYLLNGVESWTFVDAEGQAIPVTRQTITEHLLSDFALAEKVADKADDLYMEPVLLPLLRKLNTSSPTTPTRRSTSATRSSKAKTARRSSPSTPPSLPPPTPLKRSSTTTTQTASTAATLVALASASSS